jgi:hypothetical protein
MADDEPEIADAEGEEAEEANNAPEPVEEVEMSVLDALKEVRQEMHTAETMTFPQSSLTYPFACTRLPSNH